MRRALLLAIGLVLCSMPTLAGEYLMNEEVAYGLRVTFSEPVTLTYFGDVLMQVSPEGEAAEFVFSGAELPAWVGHGLAWVPTSTHIISHEWFASNEETDAALGSRDAPFWIASPDLAEWLQYPQVPAPETTLEVADSTYVTLLTWDLGWDLESLSLADAFDSISQDTEGDRQYMASFSPITTSPTDFYARPELVDAACVNLQGEPCILDWYPTGSLTPFYWGCTNSPVWQDYLIERNIAAVDLGVDAILLDEIYGTAHSTWNAGGCFCDYCLAGFRDYLASRYSESELSSKFGIEDLQSFDYGAFIKQGGYSSLWQARDFSAIPLYGDYSAYQNAAVVDAMRRIIGETRQYALEQKERYVAFSANINDLSTAGLKFAELLDWFTCEAFYKDLGYPPAAKLLPLGRLADALGKEAHFLTATTTNADLLRWESTDNLLRVLIADAYAGGGSFYVPYDIYAFDMDSGTSPGSFTGELDEIACYYRFVLDNTYLLEGTRTGAPLGVLFPFCSTQSTLWNPAHQPFLDLCGALYDASITYGVVVVGDGTYIRSTPTVDELKRYSWLVLPERTELPVGIVNAITAYLDDGGTVISYSEGATEAIRQAGVVSSRLVGRDPACLASYFSSPTESGLHAFLAGLPEGVLESAIEIIDSSGNEPRNLKAWAVQGEGLSAIHLINYGYDTENDSVEPVGPVTLSIPLELLDPSVTSSSVYVLSPDQASYGPVGAAVIKGGLEIRLSEVGIWTVLCVVSDAREQELLDETLGQLPVLAPGFAAPADFVAPSAQAASPLLAREEIRDAAWMALDLSRRGVEAVDWEPIPYALEFERDVMPNFYCQGSEDLNDAAFWGRMGCHVEGVRVGACEQGVGVSVDLYDGDRIGAYRYVVEIRVADGVLYAVLDPTDYSAHLALDLLGEWRDLGSATGKCYQESRKSLGAWFPIGLFEEVLSVTDVLEAHVRFYIDYFRDERREQFFLPGTGSVAVME